MRVPAEASSSAYLNYRDSIRERMSFIAQLYTYGIERRWKFALIRLKVSQRALYLFQTREIEVKGLLTHLFEQHVGRLHAIVVGYVEHQPTPEEAVDDAVALLKLLDGRLARLVCGCDIILRGSWACGPRLAERGGRWR